MLRRLRDFISRPKLGGEILVEIYSKPDCHLCEIAKQRLESLRREWHFELREINITKDAKMMEEFGTRIPLIWVEGKLVCKYRVEERKLRQKLEEAAETKRSNIPQREKIS